MSDTPTAQTPEEVKKKRDMIHKIPPSQEVTSPGLANLHRRSGSNELVRQVLENMTAKNAPTPPESPDGSEVNNSLEHSTSTPEMDLSSIEQDAEQIMSGARSPIILPTDPIARNLETVIDHLNIGEMKKKFITGSPPAASPPGEVYETRSSHSSGRSSRAMSRCMSPTPDEDKSSIFPDGIEYIVVPSAIYPLQPISTAPTPSASPSPHHAYRGITSPMNTPFSTTPPSDSPLASLSLASSSSSEQLADPRDIPFTMEVTELVYFYRILYEATNPRVPLLERLRFLAITSQNIDMFFCKRALKLHLGHGLHSHRGDLPRNAIKGLKIMDYDKVSETLRMLVRDTYDLLNRNLLPLMAKNGIRLMKWQELSSEEQSTMREWFVQRVFPLMTPLVVDAGHPFPVLSNLSLNIAALLEHEKKGETRFVRIKVPARIARWVPVQQRGPLQMIPIEELILGNLDIIFPNTKIIAADVFRITKHYDLKLEGEYEANNLLELIKSELHKRKFAPAVRLECARTMPRSLSDVLISQLRLHDSDVYMTDGPLGLADLFQLCKLNLPALKYEPWLPRTPDLFVDLRSKYASPGDLFKAIKKGDLLLQHPYVSFTTTVQFFIECAMHDPKVQAIKISIYRTSSSSPLIKALCEAAQNKEVSVLVDLKASGDEEQNAKYARMLEQAGCHVSYGLVGLKSHAKIAMVVREEEDGVLREYVHLSTGNYNASTSDVYVDVGIITCDAVLGRDLCDLFNYLTGYSRISSFRKLVSAPMNMRQSFIDLINREAEEAKQGRPATIMAVMNGLDEKRIVRALYDAGAAGVVIKLVVRGRCRVLPGIPGISDNIQVISILGRFLEHSRIFYFGNGAKNGGPKAFIGSADWQHRNLKRRVEVLVPVEDPANVEKLRNIINTYLEDKEQAWEMLPDGRYRKRVVSEHPQRSAQQQFMIRTLKEHPVVWVDTTKR
eukprot:TRINITY_DN5974_c0_g1_i5.p1 TRINITY_DN5974_c0_g1~~TRINITY_DN5974_c0_g1_i5.p1  ORF type:complete len:953 (-),score=252.80 TRINITY_DN5974_c0_g1_i5:12-2870(-)